MLSARELGLLMVGVMLAGMIVAIVGIVRQRRRARDPSLRHPVCRRCGYRLDNTALKACSECGAALGMQRAIVPAWYRRVHMHRMRIWCAGAPGPLALLLLAALMTGIPGTPAVPGTPIQAYMFLSWPASSPLHAVNVTVRAGRDTAHRRGDLLPGFMREASIRVVQRQAGGTKPALEREVSLASDPQSPPLLPGEDGVVRDEAGTAIWGAFIGVPILPRDLSGMEVAQWLLSADLCAQISAIEAGGGVERTRSGDRCAALHALIADFLDDPLNDVTTPSLLPPGVTVQRTSGWVGGTPATPMQPFLRPWMLYGAVALYFLGAVVAMNSARRVWAWPVGSPGK